jgi:hypothetical protein
MQVSPRVQRTVEKSAVVSIKPDKVISLIFKSLNKVLCSSCDCVPLKFEKKNGQAPVYENGLFELSFDP